MSGARRPRARHGARAALALWCALGSIACGASSQAGAPPGQIDFASSGSPSWPGFEPGAAAAELTDADVDQIATRVPRERVPRVSHQAACKGPADAGVIMQVFSDFECPFCVRVAPTLARIEAHFHGRLRYCFRHYPRPAHERARPAARASLAALELGGSDAFWKLHDWLTSSQADLSDSGLRRAAGRLGLDPARFDQALHSDRHDQRIDEDAGAAELAGVEGTPAVLIGDYYLLGARSEAEYRVVVERVLRRPTE